MTSTFVSFAEAEPKKQHFYGTCKKMHFVPCNTGSKQFLDIYSFTYYTNAYLVEFSVFTYLLQSFRILGRTCECLVLSRAGGAAARQSRTRASLALSSANAQLLSQLRAAAADAQIYLWCNCIIVVKIRVF